MYLYVKLESSVLQDLLCKSAWLDQSKVVKIFFSAEFSNLTQARLTCKVLCFALSIKGKTLATFYSGCICCLCYVYESLVRSRGICLHIYLGLSRIKIMSRAWWSVQLLHKELKENTSGSTCDCCESKKEVVRELGAVTWSW